jgi:hypothetical protein
MGTRFRDLKLFYLRPGGLKTCAYGYWFVETKKPLERESRASKGVGLEESVREAAFSLEEEQHLALEEKFHEVEPALKDVLGEKKVTARTIRHIHSRLIGVRILELDHFENEEAFVLSLVRDEMDEAQQLDIVHRLLIDESAEDPRWIIDWVYSELDSDDKALLKDLEKRFQGAVAQPA